MGRRCLSDNQPPRKQFKKSQNLCCFQCGKEFDYKNNLSLHFKNVHGINQSRKTTKNNATELNNINNKDHGGVSATNTTTSQVNTIVPPIVSNSMFQYEPMSATNVVTQPEVSIFRDPRHSDINVNNTPQPISSTTPTTSEVTRSPITENEVSTVVKEIVDPEPATYNVQSIQSDWSVPMSTNGVDQSATINASIRTEITSNEPAISGISNKEHCVTTSQVNAAETPVTTYNVLPMFPSVNPLGYQYLADNRYGMHNFMSMPSQPIMNTANNGPVFSAWPPMNLYRRGFTPPPPYDLAMQFISSLRHEIPNSNLQANRQVMRNIQIPNSNTQHSPVVNNIYGGNNTQRARPYTIPTRGSPFSYNQNGLIVPGWQQHRLPQIPQFDPRNVQLNVRMQAPNDLPLNQAIGFDPRCQQMLLNPLGISAYPNNAPNSYSPQQNNHSR